MVVTLVRLLSGSAGLALLYIAAAGVYETDERRLQSNLEDFWLRLALRSDQALPTHTRMLQGTATYVAKRLTRLFGERVTSARFVVVSFLLSYATALAVSLLVAFAKEEVPTWALAVGIGLVALLLTLVHRASDSRRWKVTAASISGLLLISQLNDSNAVVYIAIILWAVIADAIVLGGSRALLERAGKVESVIQILGLVMLCLGFSTVVIFLPDLAFALWREKSFLEVNSAEAWEAGFIGLSNSLNLVTLVPPLAFIVLLLSLLVHRVLWNVLLRPLYALQRAGIVGNRRWLVVLAAFLILGAVRPSYLTPSRLFEALGGRLPTREAVR